MLVSDFDYFLPEELIAQTAAEPRDSAKLLVYNKKTDEISERHVCNLADYLRAGDVLVINNSKVFPARLMGKRKSSAAKAEVFLVRELNADGEWQVLVKINRPKIGDQIIFAADFYCELILNEQTGTWQVKFNKGGNDLWQMIEKYGQTPLPPYIHKDDNQEVRHRYQTVFAKELGSVAAPTAGLHLTEALLEKLKQKGVEIAEVTLHVGLGTFLPVKVEKVEDHKLHAEWATISNEAATVINMAKNSGGRIFAVGTTSVRVLEAWSDDKGNVQAKNDWLNIFIYPGYKFKCVDCLLTNFHLPKSSLIMLVAALVGKEEIMKLYNFAVTKKYRFYSFGDAMLIVK